MAGGYRRIVRRARQLFLVGILEIKLRVLLVWENHLETVLEFGREFLPPSQQLDFMRVAEA
jgi:hypothetical protein